MAGVEFVRDDSGLLIARRVGDSFTYSDGDEIEERLNKIISESSDLRTGSEELERAITDFPSRYHLTARRANLLRPVADLIAGERILEIGAGCGAVTRYVGDTAAEVWAVEGSERRARMCRRRCHDQPNVSVLCANFQDVEPTQPFDVVLLIGVLEYSGLYFGAGPSDALRHAAAALAPDGVLIVAIENQLGLKYLAGAPEDHAGQPFYGIDDRYRMAGFRTYGRTELTQLLASSGFVNTEFYYPFPDYKFPRVVLRDSSLGLRGFDEANLIRLCVAEDYGIPFRRMFSEEMAWPVVARNRLTADLSNSFLVVASREVAAHVSHASPIAWVFSDARRRCFAKQTVISYRDGIPDAAASKLYDDTPPEDSPIVQRFESVPWRHGGLMNFGLVEIVNQPGWSVADITTWARPWAEFLQSRSTPDIHLPPDYLDCIPANIAISEDGHLEPFDLEWIADCPLPLDYLLFRGLFLALANLASIAEPTSGVETSIPAIVTTVMRLLGREIAPEDFIRREAALQSLIAGPAAPTAERLAGAVLPIVRCAPDLSHEASAQDTLIRDLQQQLVEQSDWARNSTREVGVRDEVIRDLQRQLAEQSAWAQKSAAEVELRDSMIAGLQRQLAEQSGWAQKSAAEVELRDSIIADLQRQLAETSAWAQKSAAEAELRLRGKFIHRLRARLQR